MPDKIRFHLDEHISRAMARGLRQRSIDVTTTPEAGLRTMGDDAQMEYLRQENRVLVTCDAGSLARNAAGQIHPGIVYFPPGSRSIGEIVSFLSLVYELMTPVEMINRVEFP